MRHVGESLKQVLRGFGPSADIVVIKQRWPELVGEQLAEHTAPTALRGGRLTVRADDSGWAAELRFAERDLLDRLAEAFDGQRRVTAVRSLVQRPDRRP